MVIWGAEHDLDLVEVVRRESGVSLASPASEPSSVSLRKTTISLHVVGHLRRAGLGTDLHGAGAERESLDFEVSEKTIWYRPDDRPAVSVFGADRLFGLGETTLQEIKLVSLSVVTGDYDLTRGGSVEVRSSPAADTTVDAGCVFWGQADTDPGGTFLTVSLPPSAFGYARAAFLASLSVELAVSIYFFGLAPEHPSPGVIREWFLEDGVQYGGTVEGWDIGVTRVESPTATT